MKPFIWMDDLGTWFTNEAYQTLNDDLKDGLFPLYTMPQDQADRIAELEKDLHMLQRHYDQLDKDIN